MRDPMCRGCGGHLVFSARARGNGLCGPCTREGLTAAEVILGAIWVAAVQAKRRASFRKKLRANGPMMAISKVAVVHGRFVTAGQIRQLPIIEPNDYDLHGLEVMLGHPVRSLVPPDLG